VKPYTVEYSSAAWRHIGSLTSDEFGVLQRGLDRIAAVATAALPAAPAAGATLKAQLAGLTFRYAVEAEKRVVRLVGVDRQAPRAERVRTGT